MAWILPESLGYAKLDNEQLRRIAYKQNQELIKNNISDECQVKNNVPSANNQIKPEIKKGFI